MCGFIIQTAYEKVLSNIEDCCKFLQSCHNLRDTCIIKTKSLIDFVPFQQISMVLIVVLIILQEILEYILIHMTMFKSI